MQYFRPTLSQVVPDASLIGIDNKKYIYKIFPKLNPELYHKIEIPKMIYQSKFLISQDEVKIIIF